MTEYVSGSIYKIITLGDKDRCPNGHANMIMLLANTDSRLPSFNICHECGFIGEDGAGAVCRGVERRKLGESFGYISKLRRDGDDFSGPWWAFVRLLSGDEVRFPGQDWMLPVSLGDKEVRITFELVDKDKQETPR